MAVNNLITIVDLLEKVSDIFSYNGKNKKSTSIMLTEEEQEVVSNLAERLKITSDQAILFTAVFSITAFEREATTNDISHFLNCSTFQLFRLQKELNELCAKRMLLRERSDFSNISRYIVVPELFECILGDEIGTEGFIPEEKSLNEQFMDALQILFNDRQSKFISLRVFKKKLKKLSLLYPDVNVTKEAEKFSIFENDLIVYYDVYRNFLIDDSSCDIDTITNRLLEGIDQKIRFKRNFISRNSSLFKHNIVEFEEGNFMEGRYLVFTPWFRDKILAEYSESLERKEYKPSICKLINPASIHSKKLFFDDKLKSGFDKISTAISDSKFNQICDRLGNHGLSKGITVMLYGHPGTGKTEMVQQLSKISGREIFQVEIAEIRNKFVGESEKRLKKVFDEYRKAVKLNNRYPILLFNESDALISKRMNVSQSVDQMENTMQNILLEELEKFEGIFFATTNLILNLDNAFERRFLFKLRFDKPSVDSRINIWNEKLPGRKVVEIRFLAENYEFSGGQIDNIVKKVLLDSVLNDETPSFELLKAFCEDELFKRGTESQKIGYSLF